jgi:hypothetical protein
MRDKPSRLILHLQHPVELMGADTFLGRAHEMHRLEHLVKRHADMLENSPDLHGELLRAVAALMQPEANPLGRIRLDFAYTIHSAAMSAHRTLRPQSAL